VTVDCLSNDGQLQIMGGAHELRKNQN
jgi:hypothetical protein